MDRDRSVVQSVERALALIEALAQDSGATSMASIYRRLGVSKSVGHRLLETLRRSDWVHEDSRTGQMRLSFLASRLAGAALDQFPFRRTLLPYLVQLAEVSGGRAVRLYARIGHEKAAILEIPGRLSIPAKLEAPTGGALPLSYGPVGQLLLANLLPLEREIVLDELRPVRLRGAVGRDELTALIDRFRGVAALVVHENARVTAATGVTILPMIALPIRDDTTAVAVISIGAPPGTWPIEEMEACLPAAITVAFEASVALGYDPKALPDRGAVARLHDR